MITRINELTLRDIKGWSGAHSFEFDDITVIRGPNSSGKTTLIQVIGMTLFHPAKSPILLKQLTPTSGGSPMSSVRFSTDEDEFVITKTWGMGDQSILVDTVTGETVAVGGEAEDRVRRIAGGMPPAQTKYATKDGPRGNLTRALAGYLPILMFPDQGSLGHSQEVGDHIRNIGLSRSEEGLSKRMGAFSEGAGLERKGLISSLTKSGQPTKSATGSLVSRREDLQEMEKRREEASDVADRLTEAEYRLHERSSLEVDEINREEIIAKASDLEGQAKEHRSSRESAGDQYHREMEFDSVLQENAKERARLIEELAKRDAEFEMCEKAHSTASEKLDGAEKARTNAKANYDRHNADIGSLNDWQSYLDRGVRKEQDESTIAELEGSLETKESTNVRIEVLKSKIADLVLPTDEDWGQIRDFEEKIAVCKAQREMEVDIERDCDSLDVMVDGSKVDSSTSASESVEIMLDGDRMVTIRPKTAREYTLSELQEGLSSIYERLGAVSKSELNARQQEYAASTRELQGLEEAYSSGLSEEEIRGRITTIRARLEKELPKPEGEPPEGDISESLTRLEERRKMASEELDSKKEEYGYAKSEYDNSKASVEKAKKAKVEVGEEYTVHRETHGDDEPLFSQARESSDSLAILKAVHQDYVDNKELKEDSLETRASSLREKIEDYDGIRGEIIRLEEEVAQLRANPLLLELPQIAIDIESAVSDIERMETDFAALSLIERLSDGLRLECQTRSRSAITSKMDRSLNHVWGGDQNVILDDDGIPDSVSLLPFMDESHGSREQVNIIHAMALLSEASEGNGTFMALDDALVFADPGRRDRMVDVIQANARAGMQILIATCRDDEYSGLASKVIDLD